MLVFFIGPDPAQGERIKGPPTLLPMQEQSIWLLESYENRARRAMHMTATAVPLLGCMALWWWWSGLYLLALAICAIAAVLATLLSRFETKARMAGASKLRELLDFYGYEDVHIMQVALSGGDGSPFVIVPA